MKKILAVIFAVLLLTCGMAVMASAADAAVAAPATDIIPTVDGKMDDVYKNSTPLTIGAEGDELWGKAYLAYDNDYLWVYFEVHDTTVPGMASGNITPACGTDSAFIGINLLNKKSNTSCWNVTAVTESNYFSALYGVMRTAANSSNVWEGGHSHLNKGYKTAVVTTDDGYTAECRITWGVDKNGDAYDTETMFKDGISVVFAITDAAADTLSAEKPSVVIHTSNGAESSVKTIIFLSPPVSVIMSGMNWTSPPVNSRRTAWN